MTATKSYKIGKHTVEIIRSSSVTKKYFIRYIAGPKKGQVGWMGQDKFPKMPDPYQSQTTLFPL